MLIAKCLQNTQVLTTWAFEKHRYAMLCELQVFFLITVADATFLDGSYAAFGRVTEGMEVAEQIAKDAKPIDSNGTIPPEQQPVIEKIVITD